MGTRDDHKYSVGRTVAYFLAEAGRESGTKRGCGVIMDVRPASGESAEWMYTLRDAASGEERVVPEGQISNGASLGYLDLRRRDGIQWVISPPSEAESDANSRFWKRSLSQFVHTAVPKVRSQEIRLERDREHGRELALAPGDYIKVRGDLRPEMEAYRNLYAKVLSVSAADRAHVDVPSGKHGIASGSHRVLHAYRVLLDNGVEADIYDIEVGVIYTTHGRSVILNRRAAAFLAEAFGDEAPYDLDMEFLEGHIFSRDELEGVTRADLGDLLARLLYTKGFIPRDDLERRAKTLGKASAEVLVDYILSASRFDMQSNRQMAPEEVQKKRAETERLRDLLE